MNDFAAIIIMYQTDFTLFILIFSNKYLRCFISKFIVLWKFYEQKKTTNIQPVHVKKENERCSPKALTLPAHPDGRILHETFMMAHQTVNDGRSEECPWTIVAMPGQRVKLKVIL